MRRLTIGDDAMEQVIQEAMQRFLELREHPAGKLRTEIRQVAVDAVLRALLNDSQDGERR